MLKTEKKILTVLSFGHAVLLGSAVYPALAAILGMHAGEAQCYLLRCLWLFVPVFASWWAIRKIKGFLGYLLISAAVCWGIFGLTRCILTTGLAVLIFLIRCYVRIRRGQIRKLMQEMPGEAGAQMERELWEIPTLLDSPRVWHWGVFIFVYLLLIILKRDDLLRMVFWLLMGEVIICFLYTCTEHMVNFIAAKQHIANLPGHAVRRISWLVFGIGSLFLGIFLIPSVLYREEPLTKIHLEAREIAVQTEQELQQDMGPGMEEMLEGMIGEVKEPPRWLIILSEIIRYAATAAVLFGAIYMVCRIGKQALQSFAGGVQEEDEIIFLGEETQEGVHGGTAKVHLGEKWNSPNRKIRRKYKKTIIHGRAQKPGGWESPKELEKSADLSSIADEEVFHTLYEKARYSREGCSSEEAKGYGK